MMDFAIMQKGELMTNREAVNWLINITADIGKAEHRDLWHYEQALYEIREMFEAQPETHDKRTETHVCDCISRQAAIDAIQKWGLIDGLSEGQAIEILADEEKVPSAQPDLDEWCTDCSEYDHERHCCPRFNKVIREAVEEVKAQPEQRWISCKERLPDNAYILGAFCPRYLVMTKWGISEGWFNPDHDGGMWNVLIWFFMGRYDDESDIDFCEGDKPKLMWLPKKFVIAWMPLPEPYKEEQK